MRTTLLSLAFGLGMATLSAAAPAEDFFSRIAIRATSPDETCGSSQPGNYSCGATNEGPCCSASGYCGSTAAYCGDGCQTGFGTCSGSTTTCGQNGGASCATGYCCSGSGYCGTTADYCGATCQSAFGQCGIQSSPTSTAPGSTPTDAPGDELCGANNGQTCSNNQCCSQSGYCGTTSDYCADPGSCDLKYGRCDSTTTPAGPSTANAPRPALGSVTYSDDIYDCSTTGVVALTYDDGPYIYTEQLLDLLKSYGFTATFFITGNNNGKGAIDTTDPYPKLIQRMVAEGHQVASHTWSHYSLSNITQALRISQMVKNEMAFNNIIGKWPTYMRPPYSQCSDSSGCTADMKSLGYHRVYFDLDTQDYLNPSPNQIQNSKNIVKNYLANKNAQDYLSIQHDIVQQSVANLSSYYFDQIKARGWKGVTVGECMNDDPKNWYRSLSSSSTSTSSSTTTSSQSTSVVVPTTTSTSSTKPITTPTSTTTTSAKPTTSSTSTTSSSTRTTSTTSSAPAPTSTCSLTIGKFCGKIDPFTNAATCRAASSDCNRDYYDCLNKNGGIFNPTAYSLCAKWQDLCNKLNNFCRTCANSCNNRAFGY